MSAADPSLPAIPGDWDLKTIQLAGRRITFRLPREPDLFLDDPAVQEANRVNDYMPYWSFLWPAAPPMARALARAPWPTGSRILELGSGIGLVGLAALLRGDDVVFSDYDATSLTLCRTNAQLNGFADAETLLLDWRGDAGGETFPVIIGCEVTYDANQHEPLLNVLDQRLQAGGLCWLGDPGRYQSPLFFKRARERGYDVRILDEQLVVHDRPRENAFQIMELRRP